MRKIAFKMKLYPGFKDEYKKRHEAIWPELLNLLKKAGIYDYTIFFDEETNSLFAVQYVRGEDGSQDLGGNELVRKWWKSLEGIMETNPDKSPVSIQLEPVFHMD
jgi:L-rhamnose mutarotase